MQEETTPISPKVAAPAVATATVAAVALLASFFGYDIEIKDDTVGAVVLLLGAMQFVVGYFRRDPLRKK